MGAIPAREMPHLPLNGYLKPKGLLLMANEIIVYGSSWCGYTLRALRHLDNLGVTYNYVEVDNDPAAEKRIADWNNGRSIRPTIDIGGDGNRDAVFVNPSPSILESELRTRGFLKDDS